MGNDIRDHFNDKLQTVLNRAFHHSCRLTVIYEGIIVQTWLVQSQGEERERKNSHDV